MDFKNEDKLEQISVDLDNAKNFLKLTEQCLEDLEDSQNFNKKDEKLNMAGICYTVDRNLPLLMTLTRTIGDIIYKNDTTICKMVDNACHSGKEVKNGK